MKNNRWLRTTLIQVAGFILIAVLIERIFFPEEFNLGKFLVKILVAGLIFGAVVGFANYERYKKTPPL